jgi:adenosylmethionine-8-amino-7-oxononanoate aminotransferase
MIGALELVKDKGTKRLFDLEERIGLKVYREGLRRNLILRPLGNIIYLYLPLGIKESELKTVLKNTYESVRTVSADVKKRTNA